MLTGKQKLKEEKLMGKQLVSVIVAIGLAFLTLSVSADKGSNKAPQFSVTTLDGENISLQQEIGKRPMYIVFWATWCPSCLREVPKLSALNHKYGDEISFVAINVDRVHPWYGLIRSDSEKPVNKYMKKLGIDYNVALDDEEKLSELFKVKGTPTQILIDKKGNIRSRFNTSPDNINAQIDALLKES